MIVRDIITWLDENNYSYSVTGNPDATIDGFSSLTNYKKNTLTWVKKQENYDRADHDLDIRCVVVQTGVKVDAQCCIETGASKEVFFKVLEHFWGDEDSESGVGAGTVIGDNVRLGQGVRIGNNCSITGDVAIGDNTIIEDNVTIMSRVNIGKDCRIHSGTVIGKDGFGFSFSDRTPEHVKHYGGVVIGDRVDIGANCVVDRGTIDDTEIGDDTKIDSLTLIAHNCVIGKRVMIIGGVTIGGSCRIGDESYLAPGSIIKNQVCIGRNSFVATGVFVNKDLGDNVALIQTGARPLEMKDYRIIL